MATSGENVVRSVVDTYCTKPTSLFGFDLDCNFGGFVDLYTDEDGSAWFTCPSCATVNHSHVSDW